MTKKTEKLLETVEEKLNKHFMATLAEADAKQLYSAISLAVADILSAKKQKFSASCRKKREKRVYYLCMEFLLGRSLKNNLFNLKMEEEVAEILKGTKFSLENIYESEPDAGLGNGGLGRLAACFFDSLATGAYSAMGFTIRYEYGLFAQKIVDNTQVELPDFWLDNGNVQMVLRPDKKFEVKMGGHVREYWEDGHMKVAYEDCSIIEATAYDVIISGYDTPSVATLRLWQASAPRTFDMHHFSQGRYFEATKYDNEAELISKVLYPSDDQYAGKQLRLSQQYFLVCSSLQSIIKDHLKDNKNLDNLPDCAAIHINDTHPALVIPELMRIMLDEYGYSWEKAWDIVINTVAYTNHTIMSEALEKWNEDLLRSKLPRIYSIIKEIDSRFKWEHGEYGEDLLSKLTAIGNNQVRMANLSIIGSHSVNGVSELHSNIIKQSTFADFYQMFPERFTNVTNGIAHRRWLAQANPMLTTFIKELIGDRFYKDASELEKLLKYTDDVQVLAELEKIKHKNKESFAKYVLDLSGRSLNVDSRFDTQIKRLHEYKRQLLNVLKIIKLCLDVKDGKKVSPQTFIFGAKAAGSYFHAKRIIKLINCLSDHIAKDKKLSEVISVYFVENYNVSKAERLIPASEVSEQISLAGKEASGTSNMKFMLNGALTLGTVDGANVEIMENVGNDNIFTFGLKADETVDLWNNYSPSKIYTENPVIKRVLEQLSIGFAGESFADIKDYLIVSNNYVSDPYMCLADFDDYIRAADEMDKLYQDSQKWNRSALVNIAKSGVFAADRSIAEYANNIWHIKKHITDSANDAVAPKSKTSSKAATKSASAKATTKKK